MIETAIAWAIGGFALAMSMNLVRLFLGPTASDRILALDTLYINTLALLILFGLHLGSEVIFEAAIIIAMLGFVGTVVLAKYVIRRDIID